jgi:hypothetical protein
MRINAASASNPALLRQIERRNATETGQPKPAADAKTGAAADSVAVGEAESRQWPGKALGIQKIIDSGRAIPAAPNSRVGAAVAQARAGEASGAVDAPSTVPVESSPESPQSPLRYGDADVAYLNEAWGATSADAAFRADYDFNADGVIDGADLGELLGRYGELKPTDAAAEGEETVAEARTFTQADVEAFQAFWGAREGEEGFVSRFDLNSDGVLDGADLGLILGSIGEPRRDPGLQDQPEDTVGSTRTDTAASPAVAEAVSIAEETIAAASASETGFTTETRVLEASDFLRVLDGLREDSVKSLGDKQFDRARDLDSLRESLVASLLTPSRTDALSNLQTLLERLGGSGLRSA